MKAIAALLSFGTLVQATQLPLQHQRPLVELSRESSPSHITSDGFTTISHPDYHEHAVRVKETTGWCDPGARSYTGYLDSGSRSLFFYFFESRRAPAEDDLMLWTNGGPGCSSSMGLFMELGPCTTQPDGNSTKPNPHSWNNEANLIFLDQPIDVGFSHGSGGFDRVSTTEQAAIDVHAFVTLFMEAFPHQGRRFHLAGESYGGRYLPVFATEIIAGNERLARKQSKDAPINLQSVSMTTSYYEQTCSADNGLGRPVLGVKQCIEMQQEVKRCEAWLEKECRQNLSQPQCDIAIGYCYSRLFMPLYEGGINPYDISKPCTTVAEDLCYPETSVIKTYLDQPWVRETFGVDPNLGNFSSCNNGVASRFGASHDSLAPTFYHLTALLETGVRVLIYVGKLDWICNYRGNRAMIEALEWSGKKGFNAETFSEWKSDIKGSSGGESKSFGNLTYFDIRDAGHMAPLDRPEETLWMVKRWLRGDKMA